MAKEINVAIASEYLSYNGDTGSLVWIKKPSASVNVGDVAGVLGSLGYVHIKLKGQMYVAHRIAWALSHGDAGAYDIDHINRIKSDNRICNLRLATRSENCQNVGIKRHNKSGVSGVFWHSQSRKWEASIRINGVSKTIGRFHSKEDAIHARLVTEAGSCSHSPLNEGVK